jgi:hypothetical protein
VRALCCAVLPAAVLTACATDAGSVAPATVTADLLTVVAVGDSITAADSPDVVTGSFGPGSWVPSAEGPGVDVIGGWAVPGATTAAMRAGVRPLPAEALVVLAGTNDVGLGVPWEESAAALGAVVATVGVDRVLVCSIPPYDAHLVAVGEYNSRLAELAAAQRWEFVDCGAPVRDPSGAWLPGMTDDGVHPTVAGAELIGAAVYDALAG